MPPTGLADDSQRGNATDSVATMPKVCNFFYGFSLWRKPGYLTSWRNLTIFVVRDPLGLRATANSPDLSCGSLIVKIKTLPMASAVAARPPVLYLALCIVRYGRTFASKVCTRRFRKRATSTHLYWKIKYEPHFDMKNDLLFDINYDLHFDRSPFL